MLKEIFILILLALSIPIGYLIAYMARDELIIGRKWIGLLAIISAPLFFVFIFTQNYAISSTLVFIFIVSYISLIKSKDKKWTKKRL